MDQIDYEQYTEEAANLLSQLISTPSFSKEEETTATLIDDFLVDKGIETNRIGNNIICSKRKNQGKPILVLNSHHDTVRPSEGWDSDPFIPLLENDKVTGLGSNDAGGCLVALMMTFIHYYDRELPFQLMLIASAEEEISGSNGLKRALAETKLNPSFAIVGEPTDTNLAIAEKGLLVIDAYTAGVAGHAAHQYEDNAIIHAIKVIKEIESLVFEKVSDQLGPVKLTVTQINAGKQHNVVPDRCHFVIDCRVNEHYSNEEILTRIQKIGQASFIPRSLHLNSSKTPTNHDIVNKAQIKGKKIYGSPTLSDQVFFKCPSVKIGPGDSSRSHRANEYILKSELRAGIKTYIELLSDLTI